jgi:hypothetical protein
MVNGQWSMVNGQWSMVNGQWSMVNEDEVGEPTSGFKKHKGITEYGWH